MSFYTILIAVGRIGAIWATKAVYRKSFSTLVSFAIMMAILNANKSNKKKDGRTQHKIDKHRN